MTGKYTIMENQQIPANDTVETEKKPNDSGQILVEGFVRITDPDTKEVLVETRA